MRLTIEEAIARAIDTHDAQLAGVVADRFRAQGLTYRHVLERFQRVRPGFSADDFEGLLYDADFSALHCKCGGVLRALPQGNGDLRCDTCSAVRPVLR